MIDNAKWTHRITEQELRTCLDCATFDCDLCEAGIGAGCCCGSIPPESMDDDDD